MAAAPYRAYGLDWGTLAVQPGHAQRRPAKSSGCVPRPDARWRLRLTGPTVWTGGRWHCRPGRRSAARQRVQVACPGLMPGGGCALPGLRTGLGDAGFVGRASAAPPGKVYRPRSRPDARSRLRLTGPGVRLAGARAVGRARAAPPGKVYRPRSRPDARWRLRLTGPGVRQAGASSVGRASAAPPGKVFRPGSRPDARWRLRLTGPGVRQAGASSVGRASAAPPGKVFRPRSRPDARWRLRLTGPTVGTGGRWLCRPGKRRAARQGVQAAVPA